MRWLFRFDKGQGERRERRGQRGVGVGVHTVVPDVS